LNIVGLMPCRNEDWVLGLTLRAALMWCDEIVVLDHASTDNSRDIALEIAEETPKCVTIIVDDNPVWTEMAHRQKLLDVARELKATHIALIDADEILSANLLPPIRGMFEAMPPHRILQIPWLALRGSLDRVHISGPWADGQNVTTGFVDSPELHWSNASRGGYDWHHRQPMGRYMPPYGPVRGRDSGLLHLQFLSERRLKAKQLAYCLGEKIRWPGREPADVIRRRYSLAVYGSADGPDPRMPETLGPAPYDQWLAPYGDNLLKHLHIDSEPWQLDYCRRMLSQNPGIESGLDDFGLGLFKNEFSVNL
jgi:glycosyltransferase involved in cell wall biosynthesis